ncbi:MAG: endonuclease domain-containing protein [Armatimonas sp.]
MRNRARTLRREMTPAEKQLWSIIRYNQCSSLRFLRQHPVGPYMLDFYCAEKKLAIEVDGGIHSQPDIAQFDISRQKALEEEYEIVFLRLTNDEVMNATPAQLHYRIRAAIAPALK